MIPRTASDILLRLAAGFPVIVVTGPRQSGKTTLARSTFPDRRYASLEDPNERAFAREDPVGFLSRFPDGAVLDEVQHCPDLLSYLQTRVDREQSMGRYVLTGSQNFALMSRITQSLAGRAGIVQLLPFSLTELKRANRLPENLNDVLFRGLYPPLHDREIDAPIWYASYVATYLERDVRQIASIQDLGLFQRFVRLCAARTGQLLNLSSLANDCGIAQGTARSWLGVLQASYIAFLLPPHHRNFGKRLVKTPKLYFHDTGLAAALLNVQGPDHMAVHPARPALFETLIVNELLKQRFHAALNSNLFFWRDNTGNEIDVLREQGPTLEAVEIKSGQTVQDEHFAGLRRWAAVAASAAGPASLVYGGSESYVRNGFRVVSWRDVCSSPAG
jgi:predicted AAA+ superfamily ATPase